jgi:tRNA U34 5-carboxymethylaminomethyl modifying GTPase MnmE/TrmE
MTNEEQITTFVKELISKSSEWRAMKLVTLGHGRVGKTSLLNRLRFTLAISDDSKIKHEKPEVCFLKGVLELTMK